MVLNMESGDNSELRGDTGHKPGYSGIKARFIENRDCFSDSEDSSTTHFSRPRIVLVRSHSRDQLGGSPQRYAPQRYEVPVYNSPRVIGMPSISENEGDKKQRVIISPLIYSSGNQPRQVVIQSDGQRYAYERPQKNVQPQSENYCPSVTPQQQVIYTSPMAQKYTSISGAMNTNSDPRGTQKSSDVFEHPKSSKTLIRQVSDNTDSISTNVPVTITKTPGAPFIWVNQGQRNVEASDPPEFYTQRAATFEASPYPWRKSSDSVLQCNYKNVDDSHNQQVFKLGNNEVSVAQHVDSRPESSGLKYSVDKGTETKDQGRGCLPVQVYRIRNVDSNVSQPGRIMLIRQRSNDSPQRFISVDSTKSESPQGRKIYMQQMEHGQSGNDVPKTSVVKRFVNVIADRMENPQEKVKMRIEKPDVTPKVLLMKDQPRSVIVSSSAKTSTPVDNQMNKIPKQRSFERVDSNENEKAKRNIFNNFRIVFGSCGDINGNSGDKEETIYFQDFDELVDRINQVRLKVDHRSPIPSDRVSSSGKRHLLSV